MFCSDSQRLNVRVKGISPGSAGSPVGPISKSTEGLQAQVHNHQNLFGEAQGEQLSEAAFPRTALHLAAERLL